MKIDPDLLEAVLDHCSRDYPLEACGILAGSVVPERVVPMRNAARSSRRYAYHPQQQLDVWERLDAEGLEPLVAYHSHPFGEPVPSETDVAEAVPGPLHLVVGMGDGQHVARLWRIEGDAVTEEPIT